MPLLRARRGPRGYYELKKKIGFTERVEFLQGAALLPTRSVEFYVDGKDGSDNNDGLAIDKAKATIAAAITAMNARIVWTETPWARGDILYIAPGLYAEALTALPYGGTVIGLGDAFDINGQRGVTIKPVSGSPFDATSVINCRLENVCFESPDASPCFDVENFNRNVFVDVLFSGIPGGTPVTTHGLRVKDETPGDGKGDMTGSRLIGCIFQVVKNGLHITVDNTSTPSKQASGNIIEYCYVRGVTEKGIFFHVNCVPAYTQINHCVIGDGGTTLVLGLDDDSGQVMVSNTNFQAQNCDPAHQAADAKYNNCYLNGVLMLQS